MAMAMMTTSVAVKALKRSVVQAHVLPAAMAVAVPASRGFATKKKTSKKGKKSFEDTNFEAMLRVVRGRYPEAYVGRIVRCKWGFCWNARG